MAENYEIIKGFQTEQGVALYDFDSLHGKPLNATQQKAGLLSPEDKKKIDEMVSGLGGFVAQNEPPEDINVLWIDINDETAEQNDTDAMLVDLEYRLTLLELGVTE